MEIKSFEEFWPFYVGEHRKPLTRALHYVGTSLGTPIGLLGIGLREPATVLAGLLIGYGWAWVAHFFVEGNKPASFKYPGWSYLADQKMLFYFVTGRMGAEVERLEKTSYRLVPATA